MARGGTGLDEALTRVVTPKTARPLASALGLRTMGDLLRHYPRRYERRGDLTDLASLRDGEYVTVLAEVARVSGRRMRQRRGHVVEAAVTDGRGVLTLTFFNQPWREKELRPGRRGLFAGKVSTFRRRRQLTQPEFLPLDGPDGDLDSAGAFAGEIIPVYPATAEAPSWAIARAVRVALDALGPVDDPLPEHVRRDRGLLGLREALTAIHRPESYGELEAARHRLKWDEAFVLQAALAQRRLAARASPARPRPPRARGLLADFDARLPFALTDGQRRVGGAIARELADDHPMHRLLQGEVGTGKTVVALRAMLQVVDAGGQAALLAPTEVLAQQHHRSITALLGPLAEAGRLGAADRATRVALLTGSQTAAARRAALLDAASGQAGIVVGTHALLEEQVQFADLGLVVIDEQHRFGVEQRDTLREKAGADRRTHLLVMTATPIPRTVAMTVYGDLEVSTLTELPAGRSPVATHVVPAADKPHYLQRAWERLTEEVTAGRQGYVVCPRIGDGDTDPAEEGAGEGMMSGDDEAEVPRRPPLAVLDVASMLADGPLNGLRLGVLHGRLPPEEKDAVMRRFAARDLDVLVATTVVEVGVDVPNATTMVVMDADRFGVSQLHQLRGRVGRGEHPGLALLVTDMPAGTPARERLDAVASTTDGFTLSRLDLEQRREGDVLGAAQSGRRSSLKLLALLRDEDLIREAREAATAVVDADPELGGLPALAAAIAGMLGEERAEYLEKT